MIEDNITENPLCISGNKCVVYIDGSCNRKAGICGYGIVLFYEGCYTEFSGLEINAYNSGDNVFGKIKGTMRSVSEALLLGVDEIEIRYNYSGIEYWATNEWKANKIISIDYKNFMSKVQEKIKITFAKVKAHSSNEWNDRADKLAKMAVANI